MPFKPSVLILSGLAGFAALTGTLVGCQSQAPAPSSSPDVEASTPASPSSTSVPSSPGPATSEQKPPQASSTQPSNASTAPSSAATDATETRTVEQCKVSMARVKDPKPPLNVRSSPNADSPNNIVGTLKNGMYVAVLEEQPDWFRIDEPAGWIAKSKTESNCNIKVERIQFGRGQNSMTIRDRFIGTGSHTYRLNLAKGQRIAISSTGRVFPTLLAPDGKMLNKGADDLSWSGELPTTGDYTLMMESNFKGYAYSFSVKVQ